MSGITRKFSRFDRSALEASPLKTDLRMSLLFLASALLYLLFSAPMGWAAPSVPEGAFGAGGISSEGPVVEARLLVDASAVMPGEMIHAGVLFDIQDGWHMYWRNPGDSGLPTRLEWKVEGADVGPIRWPAPTAFKEAEGTLMTYGYADRVLLENDLLITASVGSQLNLAVDADFLICKELCIPGEISLRRSVPVTERSEAAGSKTQDLFSTWAALTPGSPASMGLSVNELYSQSAIRPGDRFTGAISLTCEPDTLLSEKCQGLKPYQGRIEDRFIPDDLHPIDLEVSGSRMHPFSDGVLITFRAEAYADRFPAELRIRGVARLQNDRDDLLLVEIDLPMTLAEAGSEILLLENPWLEPEDEENFNLSISLWQAFLLAFLGGLILNLMPCVLPVLAIKVFGITERAHSARSDLIKNGAAYTLGILVTMVALGSIVISLRAAGTSVGWGFQFQEPVFVASIAALLLAFALNLFGVFEIGVPGARWMQTGGASEGSEFRASFFEGLLAVLLATPCSAPFLGTAVGLAFASSAPVILAIFIAIGLGLAAPFVLITLIPGWARILPRSGPWMLQLRAVLGFALLATLIWLLWIVGRQVGTDGMALLLLFLLFLGFASWLYGVRQRSNEDGRAPFAAIIMILLTIGALIWLPLRPEEEKIEKLKVQSEIPSFDPVEVDREVLAGRPAFIYFTADWCLTCKLNERTVLNDERVLEDLEKRNVAVFKADWTLRDEEIRQELAQFGRAGVPLYLLYNPEEPNRPKVLPELLSVDLVLDELSQVRETTNRKAGF